MITQSSPLSTDILENVRVGSIKLSLGLQHDEYIKLYGVPKSASIISVIVIQLASAPVFERVIV